jgi:hypothetical protein
MLRSALVLTVLVACGGRGKTKPPKGGEDEDIVPTFVQIDLTVEQEMDDLDGIELQRTTSECGQLLDLEPAARLGRLSEQQIRCLNSALDETQRQTAKDKISRLLLGDAYAKGDIHRWMGVAARHLAEVERADPDLVYQFAYNIVQVGNPDRMDEAIYWAGVALENKAHWEGDLYVRRVFGLYKIRTLAALKKWELLEAQYKKAPTEQLQVDGEAARNDLKTFAREWFEYAKSSSRDTTEPMRLCEMAAGTADFCQEG